MLLAFETPETPSARGTDAEARFLCAGAWRRSATEALGDRGPCPRSPLTVRLCSICARRGNPRWTDIDNGPEGFHPAFKHSALALLAAAARRIICWVADIAFRLILHASLRPSDQPHPRPCSTHAHAARHGRADHVGGRPDPKKGPKDQRRAGPVPFLAARRSRNARSANALAVSGHIWRGRVWSRVLAAFGAASSETRAWLAEFSHFPCQVATTWLPSSGAWRRPRHLQPAHHQDLAAEN